MKLSTKNLSMKLKIVAVLLGSVLLISGVALYEMRQSYRDAEQQQMNSFLRNVDALDDSIGAQFFERYGDAQSFASNQALLETNPEHIAAVLETYATQSASYDLILYVDANGNYIASNSHTTAGKSLNLATLKSHKYTDEPWFKSVMAGKFTEDKAKGFTGTYFEDASIDPLLTGALEDNTMTTGFSAAVKDKSGKVVGVISVRANFKWVEFEMLQAHHRLTNIGIMTGQLTLINSSGLILAEIEGDQTQYKRDFDTVLKVNLFTNGSQVGQELKAGKNGSALTPNARTGVLQISGYQPFDSEKFPSAIGWSGIARASEEELTKSQIEMQKRFLIAVCLCGIMVSILGWLFVASFTNRLTAVSDKLKEASEATTSTSSSLTRAAEQVAESSTEQSAAVQETVSSMSEISSMIGQTNVNVKECTAIAATVATQSEIGNQTMRRLASTMDSVSQANTQLQNIANIINEVSAKTAVINDIVFKTQLLSINASIEAARAGQHGKGFSVVAEEVGNLATMSGAAAKEIQLLISDSQKQVGQIVEVTQARAREGQAVSSEALAAFSQIAEGIQSINGRLQGVAQASREQEVGIQQITTAMGYLDKTTQQNSSVATETSTYAKELNAQGVQMNRITRALRTLVNGAASEHAKIYKDVVSEIIGEGHDTKHNEPRVASTTDDLESSMERIAARLPGGDRSRTEASPETHDAGSRSRARIEEFGADDPEFRKSA